MEPELRQQPIADEGADNADEEIADQPEAGPAHDWPAKKPATSPTSTMTSRLSLDRYMDESMDVL